MAATDRHRHALSERGARGQGRRAAGIEDREPARGRPDGRPRAISRSPRGDTDQRVSVVEMFQPNLTAPPRPPLASWALYSNSMSA